MSKKHDDQLAQAAPDAAALTAENETLKAKLAALEKQLQHKAKGLNVSTKIPEGTEYFRVKLEAGPNHVVKAVDAANAWHVFKAEMGVITSEYEPEITPATHQEWIEAQDKRHGRDRMRPKGPPKASDPNWDEEKQQWKGEYAPVAGIREAEALAVAG